MNVLFDETISPGNSHQETRNSDYAILKDDRVRCQHVKPYHVM